MWKERESPGLKFPVCIVISVLRDVLTDKNGQDKDRSRTGRDIPQLTFILIEIRRTKPAEIIRESVKISVASYSNARGSRRLLFDNR